MTKAEIIDDIAGRAGISKRQASDALDAFTSSVSKSVKKDGRCAIAGFGTFKLAKRKARTGRNPQTGDELKIPASKSITFKPAPAVKDAL